MDTSCWLLCRVTIPPPVLENISVLLQAGSPAASSRSSAATCPEVTRQGHAGDLQTCKYPLYQANPYYTALTARWLRADRLFWRLELAEAATIWGHGVANLTWGAGAGPGIRWEQQYPASVIPLLPIIIRLLSLYIRLLKIISRLLTR